MGRYARLVAKLDALGPRARCWTILNEPFVIVPGAAIGVGHNVMGFAPEWPGLPASLDFLDVNYSSRLHLRFLGEGGRVGSFAYRDPHGRGLTGNGWEVFPEGLLPLLREAASVGKPLVVTENGVADAGDAKRSAFLEDHVAVLGEAEEEGLPVHGYLHWSLVDNVEWLDGWGPRFGLLELDHESLERRERPSARTFRRLPAAYLGRPPRPRRDPLI